MSSSYFNQRTQNVLLFLLRSSINALGSPRDLLAAEPLLSPPPFQDEPLDNQLQNMSYGVRTLPFVTPMISSSTELSARHPHLRAHQGGLDSRAQEGGGHCWWQVLSHKSLLRAASATFHMSQPLAASWQPEQGI